MKETFSIQDAAFYEDVKDALKNHDVDIAIIAVPHNKYLPLIELCAKNSVHILKEKPFAISLNEAKKIKSCREA